MQTVVYINRWIYIYTFFNICTIVYRPSIIITGINSCKCTCIKICHPKCITILIEARLRIDNYHWHNIARYLNRHSKTYRSRAIGKIRICWTCYKLIVNIYTYKSSWWKSKSINKIYWQRTKISIYLYIFSCTYIVSA